MVLYPASQWLVRSGGMSQTGIPNSSVVSACSLHGNIGSGEFFDALSNVYCIASGCQLLLELFSLSTAVSF